MSDDDASDSSIWNIKASLNQFLSPKKEFEPNKFLYGNSVRPLFSVSFLPLRGVSLDPTQLQADADQENGQQPQVTHLQNRIFD